MVVWVWVAAFFRDPERRVPAGEGLLISPADGLVVDIDPVGPEGPLGCDGTKIGIFMSVFDVHVNRSPVDGAIVSVSHKDGAFFDARRSDASERNESATIQMCYRHCGSEYPLVVRQIAGLIARRIVTDLSEGQTVQRGERIGMVKFGSRVELLVPGELVGEVAVGLGQRVRAGQTILVRAPGDNGDG